MVRYLKDRGAYVLFNTNGTVLNEKNGRELIDSRARRTARLARRRRRARPSWHSRQGLLQPHRAQRARLHARCRRARVWSVRAFRLWLTGLKETIAELPDFVRVAARHRRQGGLPAAACVLRDGRHRHGAARSGAVRAPDRARRRRICERPRRSPQSLGISFNASGATEPGESLRASRRRRPWSLCRRPWTVMYFTANGRALPCCIAPFSQKRLRELHARRRHAGELARDLERSRATRRSAQALHSDRPPHACASCGLRWSL